MALHTKEEFAKLCRTDSKNLYSYFSRKGAIRVVLRTDGLIDDKEPLNQPYLKKRRAIIENAEIEDKLELGEKKEIRKPTNDTESLLDQKTRKQIEELEKKIQLYETKISKANEESIPKEHAVYLIKNYSISIKNVWVSAVRQFTMQKAISLGMTKEEIIEFEKFIADLVNEAMRSGVDEANKNIRKLAKEFAGKKGRGERE